MYGEAGRDRERRGEGGRGGGRGREREGGEGRGGRQRGRDRTCVRILRRVDVSVDHARDQDLPAL